MTRNYKRWNLENVEPFLHVYAQHRERIISEGHRPTHARLSGLIPEIAGADEEGALYHLSCLHQILAQQVEMLEVEVDHERIETLPRPMRAESVVCFEPEHYVGGTGRIRRFENVRILPDPEGRPTFLLPPMKRTRGYAIARSHVYAKGMRPV